MRTSLLFVLFALVTHASFAQNIQVTNDSFANKYATIIFFRNYQFHGGAVSYKVLQGDSVLGRLKNNSFIRHSCLPGKYDFQISKLPQTKLHVRVEPGKTYYIRFGITWYGVGMGGTPEFLLVDSAPLVNPNSNRKLIDANTPVIRFKNRFGLNVNGGGGFESIPILTTTTGETSKISFGGGVCFGLKYGHEFTKHFDLAIDLSYQFSDLSPTVSDADIFFGRGILSITPSYIAPIQGGDKMRMKFGVGPDFYFGPDLIINTVKVTNGFDDKWKYKSTFGYHLSMIFEANVSSHWSVNIGLKLYYVSYTFDKGNDHAPTDPRLITSNGSGMDLLTGIYYHF